MKLVLYSFVGSALVFIGILAVFFSAGGQSLCILELVKHPLAPEVQIGCSRSSCRIAVLAGMWPFHTWAPTGHVPARRRLFHAAGRCRDEARLVWLFPRCHALFPQGLEHMKWWIAVLAVIGIVYGAGVGAGAEGFKFHHWLSSVSHMGFVLLGADNHVRACRRHPNRFSPTALWRACCLPLSSHGLRPPTHTRQLDNWAGWPR